MKPLMSSWNIKISIKAIARENKNPSSQVIVGPNKP